MAKFILLHCRGTGRPYDYVIVNFSGGNVTKEFAPEEYQARMDNLYVRQAAIVKEIDRLSEGKLELVRKHVATGVLSNGKPSHHVLLLVKPRTVAKDG